MRGTRHGFCGPGAAIILGALVAGAPAPASAQMELGVIQGTVQDESGHPLEGVTFRLRDVSRGRSYTTKSDRDGRFYRRGLPAVEYEIVVEKDGYQPIKDKLKLDAGVPKRFDFKLARAAPAGAEEFVRGVEAFNRGDAAAAAGAFEAALVKAPDAPEVRVNLALAYLRLKRTDDAVAELEKAAALAPARPQVLLQLGGAYVEARLNDKAISAFEQGLARQPDPADPLAYEATVTLGALYFAVGRNDQAIETFRKAQAARPDAPAPKLGLAKCAFSKGDVNEALRQFREVAASAPGTPEAAEAEAFIKELEKVKKPNGQEDAC
ncbi:MAG: tetratricopeptide repeat protein [Acidobacteria bacterium]|nr:tetratricopeptide repeat protein [Acidobacteriota bacterium]